MEFSIPRKTKTARQETGRGVRCLARMCQSLIRSHANGPDPKDVARVGMTMANAEQTHGPQRNRTMNGASMRRRYGGCNRNSYSTIWRAAAICVPGAM